MSDLQNLQREKGIMGKENRFCKFTMLALLLKGFKWIYLVLSLSLLETDIF